MVRFRCYKNKSKRLKSLKIHLDKTFLAPDCGNIYTTIDILMVVHFWHQFTVVAGDCNQVYRVSFGIYYDLQDFIVAWSFNSGCENFYKPINFTISRRYLFQLSIA